jgi:hypothetical protein
MSRERDIAYGRHSRIPECCIRFFVDVWAAREMWREDTELVKAVHASRARYVQCPDCLKHQKLPVNILLCRIDCGGDHMEDFK